MVAEAVPRTVADEEAGVDKSEGSCISNRNLQSEELSEMAIGCFQIELIFRIS